MNLRRVLKPFLLTSLASLMFSTPVFSKCLSKIEKHSFKSQNKVEDSFHKCSREEIFDDDFDYSFLWRFQPLLDESSLEDNMYYFDLFNKKFENKLRNELKTEHIWAESQFYIRRILDNPNYLEDYEKWDDERITQFRRFSERAIWNALDKVLSEFKFYDHLTYLIESISSIDMIRKKEKIEFRKPLDSLERNPEERIEEKISNLNDDYIDYKKAGNFRKADEIKREIERLRDKLYQKRKFKISFGLGFDCDDLEAFFNGDYKDKEYIKFTSRYLGGKFSYSTLSDEIEFKFSKDFFVGNDLLRKFETRLDSKYQNLCDLETRGSLKAFFNDGTNSTVTYTKGLNFEKDVVGFSAGKSYMDGLSLSFEGNHDFKNGSYEAILWITFEF